MSLRRLLSTAYAALARGLDEKELAKFDRELEQEPRVRPTAPTKRAPTETENRGVALLMAAAQMPQAGAGAGPKRKPKTKTAARKRKTASAPRPRGATT